MNACQLSSPAFGVFAQEVVGCKALFTQAVGQSVSHGGNIHSAVHQFIKKCRHQDRVPRIVELKLVNAHEFAIRELINSIAKAKKSNHVGEFNESAK